MISSKISQVLNSYSLFQTNKPVSAKTLGNGLIHETFLIQTSEKSFVLQAYNQQVFQYPERIAKNLALLSQNSTSDHLPFALPLPVLNDAGEQLTEIEGKLWRLFPFIEGQTVETIRSRNQAELAARAFAQFSVAGRDIPQNEMEETIPNFHRLDLRYEQFCDAASAKVDLSKEESEIMHFYLNQKPLIETYLQTIQDLPLRLTHNDTKINNLIFSESLDKVKALIDLDTVMPGYLLYDFGDLVRTVACSLPETSLEWDHIHLDEAVFESLLYGYLSGIAPLSTDEEDYSLLIGGEVMTCLMGLRFFTDHLRGNVYYRVLYPEQNFHRAKNQMILLRDQQNKRKSLETSWRKMIQKTKLSDKSS